MKLPKILYSKLFLAGALIVLLVIIGLELKQWNERRKIDAEISQIEREKAALESRNQALQQSLQYFASDSYKEKLAREQLGLKKEGELVVNFPPPGIKANSDPEPEKPKTNPQKWWDYIFNQS